jgi:hypothetical protein
MQMLSEAIEVSEVSIEVFIQTIFPNPTNQPFLANSQNQKYSRTLKELNPKTDNYYTICTTTISSEQDMDDDLSTGNNKTRRRRKDRHFISLNVVVCDDVNTKAIPPPLVPSYIIESSPNNYQWGYILQTPETDLNRAKYLTDLIATSGYSDPGASNAVRLVRLPSGTNTKNNDSFKVNLQQWSPSIRYDYDTLVRTFNTKQTPQTKKQPFILPEVIMESAPSRNDTIWKYACSLIAKETPIDKAKQLVTEANSRCIDKQGNPKPLPIHIVHKMVDDAQKLQQKEDEDIFNNYTHIGDKDNFYNEERNSFVPKAALNTQLEHLYPGKGAKSFVSRWSRRPTSRKVDGICWNPKTHSYQLKGDSRIEVIESRRLLNIYNGYPIEPIPGSIAPWLDLATHLIQEPDYRQQAIDLLLYKIAHINIKPNWYILHRGISGAGKDQWIKAVHMIFGTMSTTVNMDALDGKFDDYLIEKVLVQINESKFSRTSYNKSKQISASEGQDMKILNPKTKGMITQKDYMLLHVTTEDYKAAPIEPDDRRPHVIDSPNKMPHDQAIAYQQWLDDDGPNHLLHYALNYTFPDTFSPFFRPSPTTHFMEMHSNTRYDWQTTLADWLDTNIMGFEFDFINEQLLSQILKNQGVQTGFSNITDIRIWLMQNGYQAFNIYGGKNARPQKKGRTAKKGETLIKKTSTMQYGTEGLKLSDVWTAIDEMEITMRSYASGNFNPKFKGE